MDSYTPGVQAYIEQGRQMMERDQTQRVLMRGKKFDTIAVHGLYDMQSAIANQGSIIEPALPSHNVLPAHYNGITQAASSTRTTEASSVTRPTATATPTTATASTTGTACGVDNKGSTTSATTLTT